MLGKVDLDTKLCMQIYSLMDAGRRKAMEKYIRVMSKRVHFGGGVRFPPGFSIHKEFAVQTVQHHLAINPIFLEDYYKHLLVKLEERAEFWNSILKENPLSPSLLKEHFDPDSDEDIVAFYAAAVLLGKLDSEASAWLFSVLEGCSSAEEIPLRLEAAAEVANESVREEKEEIPTEPAENVPADEQQPGAETEKETGTPIPETPEKPSRTAIPQDKPEKETDKAAVPVENESKGITTQAPAPEKSVAHSHAARTERKPAKLVFDLPRNDGKPLPDPVHPLRRFLGYVRRAGTFTNFHITAEILYGRLLNDNQDEYRQLFPIFGAVNLFSTGRLKLNDGAFFVIDIDCNELEKNIDLATKENRDDYQYRLDFNLLRREGRIREAADFGIYPVVRPDDRYNAAPDFERNIFIKFNPSGDDADRPLHLSNISVLIAYEDLLYGPVILREDSSGRPYVNVQSGSTRGIVKGFRLRRNALRETEQFVRTETGESYYHPLAIVETAALPRVECDVLSDEALLKKLISAVSSDRSSRDIMSDWLDTNRNSADLFTGDNHVRNARYARLEAILESAEEDERFYDSVAELVSDTLDRSGADGKLYRKVVEEISENDNLLRRLDSHKVIASKLEQLARRKENLEAEIKTLSAEAKRSAETFKKEERKKNKTLLESNARLEKVLRAKQEKIDFIDESSDLLELRRTLNNDIGMLDRRKNELSEQIDKLGEHLEETARSAAKYAFDGAVASKLLEAAAAYAAGEQKSVFSERVRDIAALPVSKRKNHKLADYLVSSVQLYREYDRNTVLNLFISLTQNFLTVFSGGPGSGKTSICGIMANVLGLNSVSSHVNPLLWPEAENANRYLPISVERGWTSKRDFVGYFNPLTKSFESIDERRYEAFRELDAEFKADIGNVPFVMMLDEANLSPMEYYWADFMNICDGRTLHSYISLGDKTHYHVPDTLRFLATVNNDHTTEVLSPRLIDRSSIITLPEVNWTGLSKRLEPDEFEPELISWFNMQELFGPREIKTQVNNIAEMLDELYERFCRGGFPVSVRARIAIENYISAASSVFNDNGQPAYVIAVDYALAQKLLPKISGNGEAFLTWLEELKTFCESNGFENSLELLNDIIARGNASMGYYKFF